MKAIGSISYGIAALGFVVLTVLLAVNWRGRRPGGHLVAASALTAAWAVLLVATKGMPMYFMEVLRSSAWLLALSAVAVAIAPRPLIWTVRGVCGLLIASTLALPALTRLGVAPTLVLSRVGLVTSLLGLVLLEQIYRNSSQTARGSVKYLTAGVGVLFAYDLFLYSQAELLRGITPEAWIARGAIDALAVPLIALAVRRNPQWSLDIFVSRQAVFFTTTFVGVGAYLLLMSIGGYYVREIGGEWGRVGQLIFFAGAVVVLFYLLASAALRRHARVFISKHFYRNKYDYRIEWLRFIGTLSSDPDTDVRRTGIHAIAQIFSSPAAILFSLDEPGRRFVPVAAWPVKLEDLTAPTELASDEDLPRFLERTHWIIDLQEYRRTPDIYENVTLPRWILDNPEMRILSPLLQLDRMVGFVVLYQPPPPFELTYEDRDLLNTVGAHVATHLAQHEADRRLAESGQFEAYNRLTAFMMHDLKNSVAQLQLVVTNSARHKHNPQFVDDAIETIANTVDRMTRLVQHLRRDSAASRLSSVQLDDLVREAAARCADRVPAPAVNIQDPARVNADPERLTAIIEHLIRNAQDASAAEGQIVLEVRADRRNALVTVTDTGSGMTAEFVRERLFRPFDSTKGSKGMGIGAYQVREYVRMLGGQVEVQSSPGTGTRISITLPLIQSLATRTDVAAPLARATP
ncbi:MAG TPA: XrtA/PEP-CTERM system histidine kinase PrsK [Steroidobacteraceae bacterium]|jgi:putative PEP-CTERM system histidine kinase|nr:XrtA/PEP-CTERM system histidine kinase PrsK [Steroidobacteraceae bacterium]